MINEYSNGIFPHLTFDTRMLFQQLVTWPPMFRDLRPVSYSWASLLRCFFLSGLVGLEVAMGSMVIIGVDSIDKQVLFLSLKGHISVLDLGRFYISLFFGFEVDPRADIAL